LAVTIGKQTLALCIDARLSGDASLCASRKASTPWSFIL